MFEILKAYGSWLGEWAFCNAFSVATKIKGVLTSLGCYDGSNCVAREHGGAVAPQLSPRWT